MKERQFTQMYTAVCGTGWWRYIDEFYRTKAESHDPNLVNMQIRYWIEAVEKFYNLERPDYDEETLEEGILIVNNLANSLLILGGVNWKGQQGKDAPSLLGLYSGNPFDLKSARPDLFARLVELNHIYNNLSKHFTMDRQHLYSMLTFANLEQLFRAVAEIWKFVCHTHFKSTEFDILFEEPMEIITKRSEEGS